MSDAGSPQASDARFPTTHWSRVIQAGDPSALAAREALAELCASYWYPVYAFIRRRGHEPDQAQDLTQAFFVHLLEKGTLAAADSRRGKFRSFLLGSRSVSAIVVHLGLPPSGHLLENAGRHAEGTLRIMRGTGRSPQALAPFCSP